jgi:general secretion pathway protein G
MVVIVIIGLLAGVVSFSVRGYLVAAKQNIARSEIAKIGQALDTFYTVFDRYPSNSEGLEALVDKSEKFPDGILNKLPRDPWGNPYQYNHPGRSTPYEVLCLGADQREGGSGAESDISSADLEQSQP